jgi:hypothetical protein
MLTIIMIGHAYTRKFAAVFVTSIFIQIEHNLE